MNLILNHPDDEFNLTKEFISLKNWRVIGTMHSGAFYLITSDCKVYHINNLTMEKFHAIIKTGLDLPVVGLMDTIALVCPCCTGKGITDWVSEVIGKVNKITPNIEIKFERDPNLPLIGAELYSGTHRFSAYFSRALIPEAHKHCEACEGTGLFGYTLAKDSDMERVFKMENHI